MGDTPFELRDCTVFTDNAFVAVSALNALRRDALIALENQRAEDFARQDARVYDADECCLPAGTVPEMIIFRDEAQYEAVKGLPGRLVWYPEDFREEALERLLMAFQPGIWLHLPMKCEQAALEMLHAFVTRHADVIGGVVLGSVGQLGMQWPVPYGAGEGIPVTNRRAAQVLFAEGCAFATASSELSGAELNTLMAGNPPLVVPAYGRAQLMLLHHCPARTYLGLNKGHADCRLCDVNSPDCLRDTALIDRRNTAFPLLRQRLPEGCLVRLMNSVPTDIVARVRASGWPAVMTLNGESGAELENAVAVWQGGKSQGEMTSAHWNRPVE
jgi:putative protease